MQKGPGIAARPRVTGLRLQTRTGAATWFRRHAPLAPARACELRVGRRGWPFSAPEGAAVTSLGGPLRTCPKAETKPCGYIFRPRSPRTSGSLARTFRRSASEPPKWSFARDIRTAEAAFRRAASRSPKRPFRWHPDHRSDPSALRFRTAETVLPLEAQNRRSDPSAWHRTTEAALHPKLRLSLARPLPLRFAIEASPSRQKWFPEGTCFFRAV
jgi:hypothetical protein